MINTLILSSLVVLAAAMPTNKEYPVEHPSYASKSEMAHWGNEKYYAHGWKKNEYLGKCVSFSHTLQEKLATMKSTNGATATTRNGATMMNPTRIHTTTAT